MAHVQFTDVQDRPLEFLDLTSLTLDEFQQLVPPFEAAFQAHMAAWRLDGKPLTALAQRLGVSEADAATVVVPLEEEPAPVAPIPAAAPASPLLPMTGRNGASSAPKTLLNRPRVIAARKKTTPSKMSCSSMPSL